VRRVTLVFDLGVHGIAVNDGGTVHISLPAELTQPEWGT
jgi:hypothetical protein